MLNPEFSLRLMWRLARIAGHFLVGCIIALFCGMFFTQPKAWHRPIVSWWLQGLASRLNLQVSVHGAPTADVSLWVSNHVSWMDIPLLGGIAPVDFLSKAEVAKWPLIGHLAQAVGTLFIQRGSGDSGRVQETMKSTLSADRSVLFFPEGTTTDGHRVQRFFPKLFSVACETNCPVQPVIICYRQGEALHPLAPFIGNDDLVPHLLTVLAGERIRVDVQFLPLQAVGEHDARALSLLCEQQMGDALIALHGDADVPSRLGLVAIRST
jgi:1-acyl-sn-glycerol-3-phosphate acyltransferase